jgi:hypothetical protein
MPSRFTLDLMAGTMQGLCTNTRLSTAARSADSTSAVAARGKVPCRTAEVIARVAEVARSGREAYCA